MTFGFKSSAPRRLSACLGVGGRRLIDACLMGLRHPPSPVRRLCGARPRARDCRFDDSGFEIIGLVTSIEANTECIGECRDRRPAASFTSASRPSIRRLMNTTAHDFVTVDMRGLKAALVARAQAERVSVSVLVRSAVARDLGLAADGEASRMGALSLGPVSGASVKLSIRMSAEEARQLAAGARAAGLSRGAYLAGLIAHVPVLSTGGGRTEHITTLIASCAELSTLSRNVHRLTALLRQANVEPARPYRAILDTLAGDVRRHLELAARVLADLQPQSRSARPTARCSISNSRWEAAAASIDGLRAPCPGM